MLKYKIDNEGFEKLNEVERTFYKQDGDNYQLQVEGAVDRSKVSEFRDKNIELNKEIDKFKGVDLDKYNKAITDERALREAQLIKDKDFDTLFNEKTAVITSDFQAKIDNLTTELDAAKSSHSNLISRHEIEGAASTAFTKYKISPDANDAAMSLVKDKFVINGGVVVAMKGDKIETGANGNLTIDEFVSAMPEIFKVQSKGGQGRGGQGFGPANEKTSRDKITAGLSKLIPN